MEGLRDGDGHLANVVAEGALADAVGGVEGFIVVGVCEDDEEDNCDDEEKSAKDNTGDDDTFEGFEGEPGFVAEPLEPTVRLALHLNLDR